MLLFNNAETIFDARVWTGSRIFFTKIWIVPQNRDGVWEGGGGRFLIWLWIPASQLIETSYGELWLCTSVRIHPLLSHLIESYHKEVRLLIWVQIPPPPPSLHRIKSSPGERWLWIRVWISHSPSPMSPSNWNFLWRTLTLGLSPELSPPPKKNLRGAL